jgi:hypothetical protein
VGLGGAGAAAFSGTAGEAISFDDFLSGAAVLAPAFSTGATGACTGGLATLLTLSTGFGVGLVGDFAAGFTTGLIAALADAFEGALAGVLIGDFAVGLGPGALPLAGAIGLTAGLMVDFFNTLDAGFAGMFLGDGAALLASVFGDVLMV